MGLQVGKADAMVAKRPVHSNCVQQLSVAVERVAVGKDA